MMYRPHSTAPARTQRQPVKAAPSSSSQSRSNGSVDCGPVSPPSAPSDDYVDVEDDLQGAASAPNTPDDLESTSISNSYSGEWTRLFTKPNFMSVLRSYGISGKLRSSRFRSVCWKLYLEVIPEDRSQWLGKTRIWRNKYEDLKNQLVINPRRETEMGSDLSLNNPLSQEIESPWNQFFLDNELRLTIKQDVIRTFPEIEFFQDSNLHEKMVDILFCFAKSNDSVAYKQGMHELLAPLIFVLHCDHQAFLHASEMERLEDSVKELLNPEFIEHDAFSMFCQIMETVVPWYMSRERSPILKPPPRVNQPFAKLPDFQPTNVIMTKLTRIHDYLLKKYDLDLHAQLERMEIAPQIYGIRWVRLLFGREFPMQDLLVLWDAIFGDGISFDLVDYIFLAMLLYLREYMLTSDYASCLKCLMRYPPVGDIHFIVQKALYLREPSQHQRPPNYMYQPNASSTGMESAARVRVHHTKYQEKPGSLMSGLSSLTRRFNTGRPGSLSILGSKRMAKSESEPMNLQTEQSPGGSVDPWEYRVRPKRGSASSLPALGETEVVSMIHPTISSQSLARLETSGAKSASSAASINGDMSPYDGNASPSTKYATMPLRGKKSGRKQAKLEAALEHQISYLQGRLHEFEHMCHYCAGKMDTQIKKLQTEILRQEVENEDELLLALAGLKQVRDVLKGTLKFTTNMLDKDEITIKDNYYRDDMVSSQASSAASSQQSSPAKLRPHDYIAKNRGLFYMDSGETSSDLDSPENIHIPEGAAADYKYRDERREIELAELENKKRLNGASHALGGQSPMHQ